MKMRKLFFRDWYGSTASVRFHRDDTVTLVIRTCRGGQVLRKTYASARGARIAMGQYSDSWIEQVA